MAAATVITRHEISLGNKRGVLATFTSIADTNTWDTGLVVCEGAFLTNGTDGAALGATISGKTVTFDVAASLDNAMVFAIGV